MTLSETVRPNLDAIAAKTAVTVADLNRAEILAHRMLVSVGEREQGPASATVTADIRHRAFTLFVRAYEQARHAIALEPDERLGQVRAAFIGNDPDKKSIAFALRGQEFAENSPIAVRGIRSAGPCAARVGVNAPRSAEPSFDSERGAGIPAA
jgi:hypothetical protein